MIKYFPRLFSITLLCLGLAACFGFTSAMTPIEGKANTYSISITASVECGGGCADKKADKAINEYMVANNFSSYQITNRSHSEFPENKFTYTVKYKK